MIKESTSLHDDLQNLLKTLAEPGYQKFASALLPGTNNLLGVRLPVLRQIAGDIAKGDWSHYLSKPTDTYFEETMLQGMVIGHVSQVNTWGQTYSSKSDTRGQTYSSKSDTRGQTRVYLEAFIPRIDNWSVCDSFCAGLKSVRENREEAWPFIMSCMKSKKEFEFRFGAVMLLNHYLTHDWIDPVLEAFFTHTHKDYYGKMAIAWGLSQAFAFDPRKTLTQFEQRWAIGKAAIGKAAIGTAAIGADAIGTAATDTAADLDVFIRQKTYQKILESNKVSPDHKSIIRAMKEGERLG
jgi:3-methyladenine DNA glycosylase AlkD